MFARSEPRLWQFEINVNATQINNASETTVQCFFQLDASGKKNGRVGGLLEGTDPEPLFDLFGHHESRTSVFM